MGLESKRRKRDQKKGGCGTGTHSSFILVQVPNVVRQVGLEAACGIGSRGVFSGAVLI